MTLKVPLVTLRVLLGHLVGTFLRLLKAVLPIRSGKPDFGPDPYLLAKTGLEMVWFLPNSLDFQKICVLMHILITFSMLLYWSEKSISGQIFFFVIGRILGLLGLIYSVEALHFV